MSEIDGDETAAGCEHAGRVSGAVAIGRWACVSHDASPGTIAISLDEGRQIVFDGRGREPPLKPMELTPREAAELAAATVAETLWRADVPHHMKADVLAKVFDRMGDAARRRALMELILSGILAGHGP